MPRLVRLYITQCVSGFALSSLFTGLLLWQNVANLQHLVSHSEAGLLAVSLLWLFNGLVFGSVQFAISVMRMGEDEGGSGGARLQLRPIPVRAEKPRKRRLL
ncbi:hypothetical protein ACFSDD_15315 [Salipiger marinus]|uniref:hypothetical protein n=1 Tax=Salipiger marinus TaxID=555512 RepID=UPI000E87D3B6|nr:hypothetical protein [Salipiger manganoxidans]MCD1617765.1 hypothetical protein [Salipiger manganoxidans]MEB3418297.1 hypothetical protein [Salipiger manganoxidans]HBT00863.1 hypothetical protein [Citreicella sp.]